MKLRALTIVVYWLLLAACAHAQPLPAPEQPAVVVQAPGVVVEVPATLREVTPPRNSAPVGQPQTFQPFVPQPMYQPPAQRPIPVGAVLVSRNYDERQNTSPGYWNHLCVYIGDGKVVESQAGIGVHEISYAEYRARPQRPVVIFPRTPELGQAAAARARGLVGLPYFKLSSVTLFKRPLQRGLNCVSVVEASYGVQLRRPDDAFYATSVFATSPPQ